MGKVTVEGFLSDKEVEELNRNSGGYRIITGANLNPEYIKNLRKLNQKKKISFIVPRETKQPCLIINMMLWLLERDMLAVKQQQHQQI